MPDQDYYEVLGVSRSASEDELKRAYLRLARELHPDTNPDPQAGEQFKVVNLAYETLRDPERRRQYDMFGSGGGGAAADPFGFGGAAGFADFADMFGGLSDLFNGQAGGMRARRNGPRRGEDAETALRLDFAHAVFGGEADLVVRLPMTCGTCSGSGAQPGTSPITCSTCNGMGEVRRVRQSVLGQMVTAGPCPSCGGLGEEIPSPCPDCRGDGRRTEEQTLVVDIPPGVDGSRPLRLTGRGASGVRGGPPGDLYVRLVVSDHPTLRRTGSDLAGELHVTMTQAALGARLPFESLDGQEEVTVPAGAQTGKTVRVRGKGVPHGRLRGDLLVSLVVDTPTDLSKTQEDLLRQLASERGEPVAEHDPGLMSRIRGAFK